MPTVADIVADLERFAPPSLAAEWDNVGLLLGDSAANVSRILTCLTVTPEVVAEAIAGGCNLIVTHHPILFRGAKRITSATADGRMLLDLVRANIAVYSPHTAFDNTAGGINDQLAARLGLADVKPLRTGPGEGTCKIAVFVPQADLAAVSDAMFAAGGGCIGQYRECSFRIAGQGTFFGQETTNPAVGQKGRREDVEEWRLEVICPTPKVETVVAAMRKAHSYEEPAVDVYPLRAVGTGGEGRIGRLAAKCSLQELALRAHQTLSGSPIQLIGDAKRQVDTVAIACGAGGEFLADAVRAGADAFVTGEMRFHECLAAQVQGIGVVLPGHYATERFAVETLAVRLQAKWPECKVAASAKERDPITWVG